MRTRSNTTESNGLQSGTVNKKKGLPKSASISTVLHVKMKAKKPKTPSSNPQQKISKPKKNSVNSEPKVSQPAKDTTREAQILSSDGLLMKLQQEDNLTRLSDREEDSESSGDEELPAIFDSSAPKMKELAPGTLVWAKSYKWPHWPAVLLNFYRKKKKARVVYFDGASQPAQINQVSSRSLVPFSGPDRSKYIDLGRQHKYNAGFEEALERADDYLIKRGLGKSCDGNTLFLSEFNTSYQSPPTSPHPEPECPVSPCRISASHDSKSSDQTIDTAKDNLLSSDEELRVGFPVHNSCLNNNEKKPVVDTALLKRQNRWIRAQNRLLTYIRKEETKNYLLAVYKGREKSERHSLFRSMRALDRQKLRSLAGFGPIVEDEALSNLTDFLRDLYVNHCMESKEDLPNLAYITEVWLPEAIIFAIRKTRHISRAKAEALLFSEGVQSLLDLGEDMPTYRETVTAL